MREKLAAARQELGTDSLAKMMTATGASRSNVRTQPRSLPAPVKLGRRTLFQRRKKWSLPITRLHGRRVAMPVPVSSPLFRCVRVWRTRGGCRRPSFDLVGVACLGGHTMTCFFVDTLSSARVRPEGIMSVRADASAVEAVADSLLCTVFSVMTLTFSVLSR